MAGVAAQDGAQKPAGGASLAERESGLRLKKERGRVLARRQVVVEEKHRWQGGGEVVDLGRGLRQLPRIGEQAAQEDAEIYLTCKRAAEACIQ